MAPWLRTRFGPTPVVLAVLLLFALDLAGMTVGPRQALPVVVIVSGALLGINNALFTSLAHGGLHGHPLGGVGRLQLPALRWAGGPLRPCWRDSWRWLYHRASRSR